jgi:cytochrome c553
MRHPYAKLSACMLAIVGLAAIGGLAACANGENGQRSVAEIEHMCSSCHGINGISVNPTFPQLAGQQHDYLVTQLTSFRDRSRAERDAHTYMWGMAFRLSDSEIDSLASVYANRPPPPGRPAAPSQQAAGAKIYFTGLPDAGVPACKTCHGETAAGTARTAQAPSYPRLAGQHRDYLDAQLRFFASKARDNPTMHRNAMNLNSDQIEELAAFISGL